MIESVSLLGVCSNLLWRLEIVLVVNFLNLQSVSELLYAFVLNLLDLSLSIIAHHVELTRNSSLSVHVE